MKLTLLRKRHGLLGSLLAATAAATLWASQIVDGEDEVQAVAGASHRAPAPLARPKTATAAETPSTRQAASLNTLPRTQWPEAAASELAAWMPPPPPPPVVQQAVAPAAPPVPEMPRLPYELIGRLVEAGRPVALLAGPMRTLAVPAGELIDRQWQVDAIDERGLTLTHKPTGTRQTLPYRMTP
ncbi:hypothetical protein ACFJGW_14995 [Burkholderiaceae bacterium UC74_6]